ncbi:hypothetical protein LCGC14_1777580 [marine sediment metagenome]|uniref:Uncharacterized protein n=1 Tax=marine sediment metagenome TaxID=412755 RepID=A0A0F9HIY1_9ZZZZ
MKIKLVIKYQDTLYEQPDCYMNVDEDGEITMCVMIDGEWGIVDGEIVNIVFVT